MQKIKENDEFILDIKRLGINGEGIGYYNKLAIFVPNAIPGEGHNVKITKVDNKMAFAKSLEIKHNVDYRVEPQCKYYNDCGGCNVMHIDYNKMLEFKRNLIIEALNRYTKLNTRSFEIKPTVSSSNFGYRNRSQLNVVKNEIGSSVAMIKANSNINVSIDTCPVQNKLLNEVNNKICKLIDKLNVSIYSYKINKGIIRYITIRVNKKGECLVDLVCFDYDKALINKLADEIIKIKEVKGVYSSINTVLKSGAEIIGDNLCHLKGEKYIIEELGKIKYQIYPNTFFQLNSEIAEKLYNQVLKSLKLSFKETILDVYCGVGSISLYIAHNSKEVIGIEYNKNSIIAAEENAKLNKIENAKFYQGNAHELLLKMIKDGKVFDAIVLDPPRTGLDDKIIEALLESNVKKIIYVSCNPQTFAKNLDKLSEKYNVNSIIPFDMFPNTSNVETVCCLSRKNFEK